MWQSLVLPLHSRQTCARRRPEKHKCHNHGNTLTAQTEARLLSHNTEMCKKKNGTVTCWCDLHSYVRNMSIHVQLLALQPFKFTTPALELYVKLEFHANYTLVYEETKFYISTMYKYLYSTYAFKNVSCIVQIVCPVDAVCWVFMYRSADSHSLAMRHSGGSYLLFCTTVEKPRLQEAFNVWYTSLQRMRHTSSCVLPAWSSGLTIFGGIFVHVTISIQSQRLSHSVFMDG